MSRIITLIDRTTPFLQECEADYEKVSNDSNLRFTFHQAGKRLTLVRTTLEQLKVHLQNHDLGGRLESAKIPIKACAGKAESARMVFHRVSQSLEHSRFKAYNKLIAIEGKGYMVEVLVKGMMEDVCELAKQSGIEEKLEDELEDLHDATNDLAEMASLELNGEEKAGNFAHYGEGGQFNALGFSKQNNNAGDGNQFPEAVFHAGVNVGVGQSTGPKDPDKSD